MHFLDILIFFVYMAAMLGIGFFFMNKNENADDYYVVNMNLMTVDITDVPEAKKGDEAVLIGNQGDLSISVASFSELSNLPDYELLTRLNQKIPRIVV